VFDVLDTAMGMSCSLDQHPRLKAHTKRVAELPNIAAWLKTRPVTEL